jgi:hypothetical protein
MERTEAAPGILDVVLDVDLDPNLDVRRRR